MKQVIYCSLTSKISRLCLVLLLTFSTSLIAQEGDPVNGKSLYNSNCAACHKLDAPMTGPALRNVESRLADDEGLDREWLKAWIRNSSAVIKSGDAYANKVYNAHNGTQMTPFPQLSDQDIADILAYTAQPKPEPVVAETQVGGEATQQGGVSNDLILGALALLFGLLALALVLVNRTLNRFAEAKDIKVITDAEQKTPLWKAFVQNQFLVLVTTIVFLLASGYFVYGFFMQVGVDQGYEPVQPIHYSHRIHAGDNGIDCKYCHSSARVSKTSGIPSLNVCMNCHKSISEVAPETLAEGNEYGVDYNAEIKKLYDAVGWDGTGYTGESKPVKWIRIHNLPDFAYFNHSQHVSVGGIECQTCHGPVEEMEIMYQHAPLTMGWCINCHRETNVKVKDNEYYTKIHDELSKKYGVDQLTVAQMGGLECGKCHY
ncbi:c-type cytochrome [Winogradskyella rapida]|uniref:C-type cytochrome n=1 Tax=Winogradskyella rapida TaxID=549701 RepID=A0ABW3KVU3_9FLAO